MFYIFDKYGVFLASSDFKPNIEDLDSRGEVAIECEQVYLNPYFNGKKIIDRGTSPSKYHVWNGKKWVLNHEHQQTIISAHKNTKLAEINSKAQAFVNDLAKYDETPPFERDTWSKQAEEAQAWAADPSVVTPTLALIAQTRGVPLDMLRRKALEKAMAYQAVAAVVAGQRQAYEDKLNAAETLEQIQEIEPVYQLPQQGE